VAVSSVLDEHIRHVADRIDELRTLQKQLHDLRKLCASADRQGCGILQELARRTDAPQPPAAPRHVRGSHSHRARR
jgi:hypothetical protein